MDEYLGHRSSARASLLSEGISGADVSEFAGRLFLNIQHLGKPAGESKFHWPLIVDFELEGVLTLGPLVATVISNCRALGGIIYHRVAYVFVEDEPWPLLVLAAETNEQDLDRSAADGEPVDYYLGLFTNDFRRNLGQLHQLDDLNIFLETCASTIKQLVQGITADDSEFRARVRPPEDSSGSHRLYCRSWIRNQARRSTEDR